MCRCFRCEQEFPETQLTWVALKGPLKIICDECKKEKKLWYPSRGLFWRLLHGLGLVNEDLINKNLTKKKNLVIRLDPQAILLFFIYLLGCVYYGVTFCFKWLKGKLNRNNDKMRSNWRVNKKGLYKRSVPRHLENARRKRSNSMVFGDSTGRANFWQ